MISDICIGDDAEARLLACLREKWGEVPTGLRSRSESSDLLELNDKEFLEWWEFEFADGTTAEGYSMRGWYHELYARQFSGKRVADIGSGLGFDGVHFAKNGANVTFVDIVQSNLEVVRRICRLYNIHNVDFVYLESLDVIDSVEMFDFIWCQGSMINAPFDFMKIECTKLLEHLKVGGRWIELGYPEERWLKEGRKSFETWGACTDGERTPWVEWYDLKKLRARLSSAQFETVLAFNFHDNDFNWFDLKRIK